MSLRDAFNSSFNPFEPREDWIGRATWWWGPGRPPNVFGSGRQYMPFDAAQQAAGRSMIAPDADLGVPLAKLCDPTQSPFSTSTVGAGILSPVKWRGQGIFADNYALPDYVAREPNEGWWLSEAKDSFTGENVWMTTLSGLGAIDAGGRFQVFEQRQFVAGPGGAQGYYPEGSTTGRWLPYGPRWRPGTRIVDAVAVGAHWVIGQVRGVGGGRRAFRRSDLIAGGAPEPVSYGRGVLGLSDGLPTLQSIKEMFDPTSAGGLLRLALLGGSAYFLWQLYKGRKMFWSKRTRKANRRRNGKKLPIYVGDRVIDRSGDRGKVVMLQVSSDNALVAWDGPPFLTSSRSLKSLRREKRGSK